MLTPDRLLIHRKSCWRNDRPYSSGIPGVIIQPYAGDCVADHQRTG
jgi:hypothetical protein